MDEINVKVEIDVIPFGTVRNQLLSFPGDPEITSRPIYSLPLDTVRVEPSIFGSQEIEVL